MQLCSVCYRRTTDALYDDDDDDDVYANKSYLIDIHLPRLYWTPTEIQNPGKYTGSKGRETTWS